MKKISFTLLLLSSILFSCKEEKSKQGAIGFLKLDPTTTGISFTNKLIETDSFNYFNYPYIYMGGGVSIADFNNDGKSDVYFTGNMVADKLYLNKGDMQFEDVTISAGISDDQRWHTGVTVVDINADGNQDIYVSVSGVSENKKNLFYVNQGDMTFAEQAEIYGIADAGNSIQSTFFDYDNDGDLDLYVANYPITNFRTPNYRYRHLMNTVTLEDSDRLYRNDGSGHFTDVTKESGLLAFGLTVSATVADFNQDGWQDIYVSNDFSTPDYFYINNQDGTFDEHLKKSTNQTSFYSMGADAADINNDGLQDFFQVDMSAEDNQRSKANMASMDVSLFWSTVNNGFHYQYMYNTLQLNRGLKKELPVFSNIAAYANVISTDWSWSPLFADVNNDGWKDLFITNGTRREINNKDYFNDLNKKMGSMTESELLEASLAIPSEPIANYLYLNNKDLQFSKASEEWGIDQKGFSNGCAYGDLDNDGDLDLVINNIDSVAWIYENQGDGTDNHYLKIKLIGSDKNLQGIGSEVQVYANGTMQMSQLMLTRGFQSSVEPTIHFGLGVEKKIDSILVKWPNGHISKETNINADQTISISQNALESAQKKGKNMGVSPYFTSIDSLLIPSFIHRENPFNDYAFQVLLPHKMSNFGPALATGDINGDGLEDVYVGGAANQASAIYIQNSDGHFIQDQLLEEASPHEDIDATFFDVDNDQDLDLYVVSGGNEFDSASHFYQDRLYINENGSFQKSEALPKFFASGGCVRPFDFDQDGDLDIFIGGRLSPRHYPFSGQSVLLVNQSEKGSLAFENETTQIAPSISDMGMVTDAIWFDVNNDDKTDLIVVGEWMDIVWLENTGGSLKEPKPLLDQSDHTGWWFSIEKGDFDNDGDEDLMAGNLGLNYKYQASEEEPFDVFVSDFDKNGKDDIILSYYNFGLQFPVRGMQCSSEQIPALKSAFKNYDSFSTATVQDIFGTNALESSLHYSIQSFASVYMENKGDGTFVSSELPPLAQIAPINDIQIVDLNNDGNLDAILAGNLFASEVETPRADGGNGLVLLGDGKGNFTSVEMSKSGLNLNGDVKHLELIRINGKAYLIAAINNGPLQYYQLNQ